MNKTRVGKTALLSIFILILLIAGTFLVITYFYQESVTPETSYKLEQAYPNLTFNLPVGLYSANDQTNMLYVVEQQGTIQIFENNNQSKSDLFLDIKDRVISGGEQGLLGLAFHPNFETNGYFYLDYIAPNPRRTVIARYQIDPDTMKGRKESEEVFLEVLQPFPNHNGGQIGFGPDGYLYIALGDGGSGGDPLDHGQNRSTVLGSILRIDINNLPNGQKYEIPDDNPFKGNTQGYKEEIFAYGLRNPWRFSFDPETDWLWVADVGQNRLEEINIIKKGGNYGWNIMEGILCYSPSQNCNTTNLELPLWTYGRDLGISITGGFVYRGKELQNLNGYYIYGDYGSGKIWALQYNGFNEPENIELFDSELNISSFGITTNNEIRICAFDGKIYKITTAG